MSKRKREREHVGYCRIMYFETMDLEWNSSDLTGHQESEVNCSPFLDASR